MKPIFLATDYSHASMNAGDYAAQLAKATGSELIVFHSWQMPMPAFETPVFPSAIEELEKTQQAAVQSESDRISSKWGIKAKFIQQMGLAADEMEAAAIKSGAGIIVLGMKHPNVAGQILGSVATVHLRQTKLPVLIVPENSTYHRTKICLLATDLQTRNDWHELDALLELTKQFHTGIHILNVVGEKDVIGEDSGRSGIRLENRLKDIPHTWHFPVDGDIVQAVGTTADKVEADWIAVVPHRTSWFRDLFHSSVTKKLAFQSSRPLLVLPERHINLNN